MPSLVQLQLLSLSLSLGLFEYLCILTINNTYENGYDHDIEIHLQYLASEKHHHVV